MPRVFVPQVPLRRNEAGELVGAFDLSAARKFGPIIELASSSAKPWTQSVVQQMRNVMLDNDITDEDFVLLVGSPAMCSVAVAQMSDLLDGCINMLQWNGREGVYFPIQVEL